MPYVDASCSFWLEIRDAVAQLIKTQKVHDSYLFARAQDYFGVNRYFDSRTMSPVDKLKRENVFGNKRARR